jgi:hypothetical protein
MDSLSITVEGLEPLVLAFDSLLSRLSDLRPAWPAVAKAVRDRTREKFADEGPGWDDLSERYAARKAKEFPGAKKLHATGAMEASLTEEGAEGSIYDPRPESLDLGSQFARALAHQTGVPERNLPQRMIYDELTLILAGDTLVEEVTAITRDFALAA